MALTQRAVLRGVALLSILVFAAVVLYYPGGYANPGPLQTTSDLIPNSDNQIGKNSPSKFGEKMDKSPYRNRGGKNKGALSGDFYDDKKKTKNDVNSQVENTHKDNKQKGETNLSLNSNTQRRIKSTEITNESKAEQESENPKLKTEGVQDKRVEQSSPDHQNEIKIPPQAKAGDQIKLGKNIKANATQSKGPQPVGTNWDKPDQKNIPDVVKLNYDSPSNARIPPLDNTPVSERLIPNLVPSIVHFIWCRKRWFEFKPYLSIQSAVRFIKPDKVMFHYEHVPMQDKLFYHQWMHDLQHDYPFFILKRMTEKELANLCYGTVDTKKSAILELLRHEGGIYIGESTWMLDFPASKLLVDFEIALEQNDIDGYMIVRPGIVQYNNQTLDSIASELARKGVKKVVHTQCALVNQLYNGLRNPHCVIVKGGVFEKFYPSDVWELKDTFGGIVRKIFYGTEEILKPKPSYETLVPNIGHMIWLGGGPMDFVFYLSVLSMLYVVKVDTLYIHGDRPPAGPYWIKLMENQKARPRIKFITRPQPHMIFSGLIEPYYLALKSDIIRVDIMIKYGGIYSDTDAIWVKPISEEDRGYDAVASYDWVDWSYPYPDSVNFGLSYGKKNAPFWRIFRESMRMLHNDIHGFTGVMMPYKLLEKYPHLLRIDRHLQVICYHSLCHPTWVKNYHNESIDHTNSGSLDNWRKDVNALHWTFPNPPELANETTLANSKGLFADLGKMVLKKAGLL